MTDPNPIDDESLLERFRGWLRAARVEAEGLEARPVDPPGSPEVGLYRLAEEFTALRHEVKLETKGSRGLQEQVEALLPAIRQAIDLIRSVGPREEQAVSLAAKPMAEAMADLDEALARGRIEIEKARDRAGIEADQSVAAIESDLDAIYQGQPWFRRFGLRAYHEQIRKAVAGRSRAPRSGAFDALLEGYGLIQGRLKRSMDAGQIRRIDAVGRPVDPALMTVLEVVDSAEQPPGHVVDEVRRGYTWRGRVLRYAEVRATRERAVEDEREENQGPDQDSFEDADETELGTD